jgi:hypothetical protein
MNLFRQFLKHSGMKSHGTVLDYSLALLPINQGTAANDDPCRLVRQVKQFGS